MGLHGLLQRIGSAGLSAEKKCQRQAAVRAAAERHRAHIRRAAVLRAVGSLSKDRVELPGIRKRFRGAVAVICPAVVGKGCEACLLDLLIQPACLDQLLGKAEGHGHASAAVGVDPRLRLLIHAAGEQCGKHTQRQKHCKAFFHIVSFLFSVWLDFTRILPEKQGCALLFAVPNSGNAAFPGKSKAILEKALDFDFDFCIIIELVIWVTSEIPCSRGCVGQ